MNYPIARYRFDCILEQPLRLPAYGGSMLRGAFGSSLRQIACVTGRKTCEGCPINDSCSYTTIFEPGECEIDDRYRQWPPPYVVEPPPMGAETLDPGASLGFDMVVFGKALAQLPLILMAWRRALARGLGKGKARGRVVSVTLCNGGQQKGIWSEARPSIVPHEQIARLSPPDEANEIRLRIETPLRLQRQGKVLGSKDVIPADLMTACLRRSRLFLDSLGIEEDSEDIRALTEKAKTLTDEQNLKYIDWSRYSSRQKQKMCLPGLIGDWCITGNLRPFLPALYLCELLHVGKNASFGLGRYTVESVA